MFYPDDISYICLINNIHFSSTSIHKFNDIDYIENTDDVVIMQYTGLKNKNEKEIYEGDIIKGFIGKSIINPCVIVFQDRTFVLSDINNEQFNGHRIFGHHDDKNQIEVIGNIYENPELINKKDE